MNPFSVMARVQDAYTRYVQSFQKFKNPVIRDWVAAREEAEIEPEPEQGDPQPPPEPVPGLSPLWMLPNSARKWRRSSFGSPRPWGSA